MNWLKKLREITEGFGNYLIDNPKFKDKALKRAAICAECPLNVKSYCSSELGGCGCFIPAKVYSPLTKCPKDKWLEELDIYDTRISTPDRRP